VPFVAFPEWAPDQADLGDISVAVQNVRPRTANSYGPMLSLTEYGGALNSACKGVGSFEGADGTVVVFAGTLTKLYLWDGTGWDDVTRMSGAYTLADENRWVFAQFGDYIYAVNGIDAPQVWQIGISSLFADASGSPPTSKYVATVRDFFFHANTSTDAREVVWSAQFDSNAYVVGTDQSDTQTFQEGGRITGIVGGQYVIVFQQHKITLGTYIGPELIFQFDEVSQERGCLVPGSIATYQQTTIFLDHDGFYRIDGGQQITPIGDQKVDEEIWDNIDEDNFNAVWAVIDPRRKLYIIAWPTSTGNADTVWTYHIPTGRWAPSSYAVECLFFMLPELSIDLDTDIDVADQDLDGSGLPSLDSEIFLASQLKKLGAFTPNHKLAFFDGAALEATLDTAEAQLGGGFRQVEVDRAIILVHGTTVTPQAKLGYRNLQGETVTFSSAVTANSQGEVYFREPPSRFQRLRGIIPAGSTWSHALGADFEMADGGDR
jgi:hypothetical protein